MTQLIDYDDPATFPNCLSEWSHDFEIFIRSKVNLDGILEWWQIEHQLQDLRIQDMPIVRDFVDGNLDIELAVCHCTRILDESAFWHNGLVISGGVNSIEENRIRTLLSLVGFSDDIIDSVLEHAYYYWQRDKEQRTECVHFFVEKRKAYEDDQINNFAINLGGEIVRWSIERMGHDLYKEEPL